MVKKTISIEQKHVEWLEEHKEIQLSGLVNKLLGEYISEVER